MRAAIVVTLLLSTMAASGAFAQVQSRPADAPQVHAAGEAWFQLREPIPYAGELYYPAGATVFFNGNHMVRTGLYNGVPLYADATVEPYSVVLVPAGRGLLQPYERRRNGSLAGTTGSRTPSFPVQVTPTSTGMPAAAAGASSPTAAGAMGVLTAEAPTTRDASPALRTASARDVAGTSGIVAAAQRPDVPPLTSLRRAESNDGLWIRFLGERWVSAGGAVPFAADGFTRVGEYGTFPVFARRALNEDVIYLPTRAGLVAPYRLKD